LKFIYELLKSIVLIIGLTWIITAGNIYISSYGDGGCGTGFFITPNGHLVTALHVMGKNNSAIVNLDRDYRAHTVARDVRNDIAILELDDRNKLTDYLLLDTEFKEGAITIYGYPNMDFFF